MYYYVIDMSIHALTSPSIVSATFTKLVNTVKSFLFQFVSAIKNIVNKFCNIKNSVKSEFKFLKLKSKIAILREKPVTKSAVSTTSSKSWIEGRKYAEAKLKEIDERKTAALKLALLREPGRWPPNITEMPVIVPKSKKSVSTLTSVDLKGKRFVGYYHFIILYVCIQLIFLLEYLFDVI